MFPPYQFGRPNPGGSGPSEQGPGGPAEPPGDSVPVARDPDKRTLIDRLLDVVVQPIDVESLGDVDHDSPTWRRQKAVAGYTLDLVGQALRKVAGLRPPEVHSTRCVDVQEVFKIMGEAPRKEPKL